MTLSDTECACWHCGEYCEGAHPKDSPETRAYSQEAVKSFIEQLKEKFPKTEGVHAFTGEQFHFAIDELAGEKLL